MTRQMIVLQIMMSALLTISVQAQAEQRVALVIGNGAYDDGPLQNPPNDARAMAQALRQCGFQVIEKIDSNERGMIEAIRAFGLNPEKVHDPPLFP